MDEEIKINVTKKILETGFLFVFSLLIVSHTFATAITPENLQNLINSERSKRNLPTLNTDSALSDAAAKKSEDMIKRRYFEHYAFNLSPWDFIKSAGYDYLFAGENLAMDFNTSEGTVNAWMDSENHRDNILNPDYRDLGVGVVKGDYYEDNKPRETIMVTTMFGRERPPIMKAFDYIVKSILNII